MARLLSILCVVWMVSGNLAFSQASEGEAETESESVPDQAEEPTTETADVEEPPAAEAPAETAPEPAKTPEQIAAEKAEKIWLADSAVVYQLIAPLRQYRENDSDSSVQQKVRKRKLAAALRAVNEKHIGKILALQAVVVDDVTAEREITKHGLKRVRQLRKQIEQDPSAKLLLEASGDDWAENPLLRMTIGFYLAGCEKCFKETGRYTAKFKIRGHEEFGQEGIKDLGRESPEQADQPTDDAGVIRVEIIKIIGSEDEALRYTKGKKMPLRGKIIAVDYDGSHIFESVKLYID